MSEMVERVAKALLAVNVKRSGFVPAFEPPWMIYEQEARVAIEAMREPSNGMCAVGFDAWLQTAVRSDTSQGTDIYRAMIDAALKD